LRNPRLRILAPVAPQERLGRRSLNRALLARQGLLQRRPPGIVEAVEAVGALQAQAWAAPPVALWSRVEEFTPDELYAALEAGDLLSGTLLRGTLHLVSAREHPGYAAAVEAAERVGWRRTKAEPPGDVDAEVRAAVAGAAREARTPAELAEAVEAWVAEHPGEIHAEELARQRELKWKPVMRWAGLVRAPADGRWGPKTPAAYRAAPGAASLERPADPAAALDAVVPRHLRAFGPADAEDVGTWLGWPTTPVRESLGRLEDSLGLVRFTDDDGRTLYDLPSAPRPGEDVEAPPRFLAAFDSALLAYASKRRGRIVADAHRDAVYERANLRVRATFIVDGMVAGTWAVEAKRKEATLTLTPLSRLTKPVRAALADEGERLLRAVHPDPKGQRVVFA
jgi:hypothetical protein